MLSSEVLSLTKRGKTFFVTPGKHRGFWKSVAEGGWEPETYRIFDRFIDGQHSYIDIGAWIGPTILYACRLAKAAYGNEPDPIAFAELSSNIECNRPASDNVRLANTCIASRSGQVSFGSRTDPGDSKSSLLFGNQKMSWTIDALSFNDFIARNSISDCGFVKMDIEGGEYEVIPSMKSYLAKNRPTLYLSMHPANIGDLEASGLIAKFRRSMVRLIKTWKVIRAVRFYEHCYDSHGNAMSAFRLLWMSRRSATFSVILTDIEWE